jgi:arginyl-tRNA synthetase
VSLALLVARFPDVVQEARITTEPCTVINYLMLLSRSISTALDRLWVMNQDRPLALARMALYTSARIALGNGLRLIGLKPLDRM